jgi:hypothetical protein
LTPHLTGYFYPELRLLQRENEIAGNLLKMNLAMSDIIKVTGLMPEEIMSYELADARKLLVLNS